MQAVIGDRLHVHRNTVGQHERCGEIVEVRGTDGAPPYMVRFEDGHTSLVYPGPDAEVEHALVETASGGRAGWHPTRPEW